MTTNSTISITAVIRRRARRNTAYNNRVIGAPSLLDFILNTFVPTRLRAAVTPASFDPAVPYTSQLCAHIWAWSVATPLRRYTVAPFLISQVYGLFCAILFAPTAHAAGSPISSALGVTDSYGVPVGAYAASTDYGTIFDGGPKTLRASIFQMETAIYIDGACLAIFILTWVVGFTFLADLVAPFADAAQTTAGTMIVPFAAACISIAGLVVGYEALRGNWTRVGKYIGSIVVVVIVGVALFTNSPIAWTLSDKGPLMAGRDFGISTATNSAPSAGTSTNYVETLRKDLATNLIRRPLQVWNFGAVADATPACASAWSQGVLSGNTDRIKDGIENCGASNSRAMKASADNPSWGQVAGGGIGFGFLLLATWLFCASFAVTIMATALRAVTEAFKLVFSSAAAVIPGAPQILYFRIATRLIFSFGAMAAATAISVFAGRIVMQVLNKNVESGVIYAAIIAAISMIALTIALARSIYTRIFGAADNMADSIARSTENTSAIIQPGATINTGGALPAFAGAAAGYATAAVHYARGSGDRKLARENKEASRDARRSQVVANHTQAGVNAAAANYLAAITPPQQPQGQDEQQQPTRPGAQQERNSQAPQAAPPRHGQPQPQPQQNQPQSPTGQQQVQASHGAQQRPSAQPAAQAMPAQPAPTTPNPSAPPQQRPTAPPASGAGAPGPDRTAPRGQAGAPTQQSATPTVGAPAPTPDASSSAARPPTPASTSDSPSPSPSPISPLTQASPADQPTTRQAPAQPAAGEQQHPGAANYPPASTPQQRRLPPPPSPFTTGGAPAPEGDDQS